MTEHLAPESQPTHPRGHVVSWKVYVAVFLALSALTAITVQVAGHDFGPFNLVVALGVADRKSVV